MKYKENFIKMNIGKRAKAQFFVCFMACLLGCTRGGDKTISGSVTILPEFQKKLGPEAVLFIIARPDGVTSGPPLAVKRFTQPLMFPLEFKLSAQDAMIPNSPFEGKVSIHARIAQTGSATPIQAGDIEGTAQPNPIPVGEKNLKIELNHLR
jgi:hypothetical protein